MTFLRVYAAGLLGLSFASDAAGDHLHISLICACFGALFVIASSRQAVRV